MNKILVSALIVLSAFGAQIASAQTYYSSMYNYGTNYSGACVNLASDISYGQKGSNVSQLQNFLVSQNYPGGGSWMVTGNFGSATVAAVRNFQQTQGLSMTGAVDASTRSAIARVSCGGNYNYNNNYTLPYNNYSNTYPYNYNNYNQGYPYNYNNNYNAYPYNYNYGNYNFFNSYGATPVLTSLSVTSAPAGASVTIFGTGFDPINNAVYVGGTTLSNIPSANTTSLTFTVPSTTNGATSVSVGNSHGMSNALTLTIGSYVYPYNNPAPYPCTYGYGYGYNCPPNTGVPSISYLSPTSGGIGTYVTIYGSGFSTTGDTVHFGNGIISNLSSYDGRSVSFTVPSTVSGYGYQPIGLGTYNISVSNSAGVTSNTMPFTITTLGTTVAPTITSVTGPTSLGIGVSGTWTIAVTNPNAAYLTTSVRWGDEGTYGYQAGAAQTQVQNQATLTFSHTYYAAGTYTVTFTVSNGSGQQNTSSASVYVSGTAGIGMIPISSISPITGPVGTQVLIQGTGFDPYNNTVHFGNGGTVHVPSQNGVIYYTVPSYLSSCDVNVVVGTACPMYAQQVTPGAYPIYITSPSGTSNTINFQVQ